MTIHKEGHRMLIKFLALEIAVFYGAFHFFPHLPILKYSIITLAAIFYLIILQFFRKPNRELVTDDDLIISPVDGKVVVIEDVEEDEYFKGMRKQLSVFMSPINVHQTRVPVGGLVKYFKYHPGKYLVAWHPKSSTENERTTCVIENKNGVEVLFRQVAGALAKRICWYVKEGDHIGQSEEYGFIKFGSRVDIYLPLDAEITIGLGEKTTGGQTVLARLKK
jgi:phosphatidylserine decarboxylase